VFSYSDPGIAPDGQPYINVTAEYHGICVGALSLAVIHFLSIFLHFSPKMKKIAHKFQILLHVITLVCAIIAFLKIKSDASKECGQCRHKKPDRYMNELNNCLTVVVYFYWIYLPYLVIIWCLFCCLRVSFGNNTGQMPENPGNTVFVYQQVPANNPQQNVYE